MEQNGNGKLIYYLEMLNSNWKLFDDLERGNTTLERGELREAKRSAAIKYEYAELKLAEMGWRWDQLAYDKGTKAYSFPEYKAE